MKKILLASLLISIGLLIIGAAPALAQGGQAQLGLDITAGQAQYTTGAQASLPNVVGGIISAILSVIGVVFVVLLVYGGIQYMTAHGNDENVKKAKDTLIAAVVGLVITVASYAIAQFVVFQLTVKVEGDTEFQKLKEETCAANPCDRVCPDYGTPACSGGSN